MFRKLAITGSAIVVSLGAVSFSFPAISSDLAVSGINGKLEGIGADVDSDGVQLGGASLSFPLTPLNNSLGLQLDAATGEFASTTVNGYGLHLFWRHPDIGLAGLTAARIGFGSTWGHRLGVEGEYYLDKLTFSANAGVQNGELLHTGFGNVDLRYFLTNNLAAEAGGIFYSDERAVHVGMEWMPFGNELGNLSFFADGGLGNHGYDHVMAGVRITFGGSTRTLKDRQRGDDPKNQLIGAIMRIGAAAGTASGRGGSGAASGGPFGGGG